MPENYSGSWKETLLHSQMLEKSSRPGNGTFYTPPCHKSLAPGGKTDLASGTRIFRLFAILCLKLNYSAIWIYQELIQLFNVNILLFNGPLWFIVMYSESNLNHRECELLVGFGQLRDSLQDQRRPEIIMRSAEILRSSRDQRWAWDLWITVAIKNITQWGNRWKDAVDPGGQLPVLLWHVKKHYIQTYRMVSATTGRVVDWIQSALGCARFA
jgi:hypothetical protein